MSKANGNGNGVPKGDGANGRDSLGRFAAGNPGGPGRKKSHRRELVHTELEAQVTPELAREAVSKYLEAVLAGERWALQDFLDRCIGKADQKIDAEVQFTLADAVHAIRESRLARSN